MRRIALACLILLFAAPLLAQGTAAPASVWFTVSPESATVAVTLPAGTTYRFGDYADNAWSLPITVAVVTTFNPVYLPAGVFPFSDPDPSVAKELDVLETVAPQAVTVTNLAASPVTAVALAIPALVPPVSIPTPPGQTYAVTLAISQTATAATPDWIGFYDLPQSGANLGYEGSVVNLTMGGVTLVCTYSSQVSGIFSLVCSVPGATQ